MTPIAMHEIAHSWLSPRPTALITSQGEASLRVMAAKEGWLPRVDAHMARDERLADACLWAWLGAADAR